MQTLAGGRYELTEEIGSGGMATVFRARDTVLNVERAIKILRLPENVTREDPRRRRLMSEAQAMARILHPNIMRVLDIGAEGNVDYVVMELADRGSLADLVKEWGFIPPHHAVHIGLQVLSGLAAAHAEGIVHRDVKPQNILLDRGGVAKLADFGIAMLTDEEALRATRTGVAMGTLAYMAPEQRIDARSVGASADVYAMGATLYNVLTGANPVDLFAADLDSKRWEGLPDKLRLTLVRATRYRPEERYSSARAMATDLLAALDEIEAPPGWSLHQSPEEAFPEPSPRVASPEDRPDVVGPTAPMPSATIVPMLNATHAAVTFLSLGSSSGGSEAVSVKADSTYETPPLLLPSARVSRTRALGVAGALAALTLLIPGALYMSGALTGAGSEALLDTEVGDTLQSVAPVEPTPADTDGLAAAASGVGDSMDSPSPAEPDRGSAEVAPSPSPEPAATTEPKPSSKPSPVSSPDPAGTPDPEPAAPTPQPDRGPPIGTWQGNCNNVAACDLTLGGSFKSLSGTLKLSRS